MKNWYLIYLYIWINENHESCKFTMFCSAKKLPQKLKGGLESFEMYNMLKVFGKFAMSIWDYHGLHLSIHKLDRSGRKRRQKNLEKTTLQTILKSDRYEIVTDMWYSVVKNIYR